MFLNEVHEQLCSAELSMLFEGEGASLSAASLPKINSIIQAGINDLNKKFSVREKEILVRISDNINVYELIPANAVSSGNPKGFILDSVQDPYLGDLMSIIKVSDDRGEELRLNADTSMHYATEGVFGNNLNIYKNRGVYTPAYNTIKLDPKSIKGGMLIKYKARIKPMDLTGSPKSTYIDLPDHFLNALVLYVASRRYNPKGAETIGRGMFHEGNNYWSKYTEECNDLKASLASTGSVGDNTNFYRGGWV